MSIASSFSHHDRRPTANGHGRHNRHHQHHQSHYHHPPPPPPQHINGHGHGHSPTRPQTPPKVTKSTVNTTSYAQQQLGASITEGMVKAFEECEATVLRIAAHCR